MLPQSAKVYHKIDSDLVFRKPRDSTLHDPYSCLSNRRTSVCLKLFQYIPIEIIIFKKFALNFGFRECNMEITEAEKSIDRNLAKEALQECENKFRILLDTIKDGVTIHDRFKIIDAN